MERSEETLTDSRGDRGAVAPHIAAPHLFVALECSRLQAGVARYSLVHVDRVTVGRGSTRCSERSFRDGARTLTIRLPDPRMSSTHACLVRQGLAFCLEDLGSRNGTRLNGATPPTAARLEDGDFIEAGHTILRYRAALPVAVGEPPDADPAFDDPAILLATVDPALARRVAACAEVARSTSPVLILGETGTGKEVLARAIHRISGRTGRFVAVNCSALPAPLIEAQLFGHVRGAFSGAVADAAGLIRSADGGTLLLDEIGDLPAAAQGTLLRVLQEHEVVPVGAMQPIKLDLRVVSATNRPLETLVERGEFRSDLFSRLAAFTFALPPLRERREDIGMMVAPFARESPVRLTLSAGIALLRYDWPLNVRNLHQVLRVARTLAGQEAIDLAHLPAEVAARPSSASREAGLADMNDPFREQLLASLVRHCGNVSEVAREMGKARVQVQRWMRRYGIDARPLRAGKKG